MKANKRRKIEKKSDITIFAIPDHVLTSCISPYLTIYENYQMLFVFKGYEVDWEGFQKRDFSDVNIPLSMYNAIHLDNGNIVNREAFDKPLITKTNSMKLYKLSNKDIESNLTPIIKRRIIGCKYPMQLFEIKDVQNVSALKHFGLTNLKCRIRKSEEQHIKRMEMKKEK